MLTIILFFQPHFPNEVYTNQNQLPSKQAVVSQSNSNLGVENNVASGKNGPVDLSRISEDSHQQSSQVNTEV